MDLSHTDRVLAVARAVPAGRVTTYGLIAEYVRVTTGQGSARLVGQVMARHGGSCPWWRVVRVDGTLPPQLRSDALARYDEEGTALVWRRPTKVNVDRAIWDPLAELTHA